MVILWRTKNHVILTEPLSQQNKHVTVSFTDAHEQCLPFGLQLLETFSRCVNLGLITGEIFFIYGRIMFFRISFRNTIIKKGTFTFVDTRLFGQMPCSEL